MTTDYKPLTLEQIYAIQDTNVDVFYVTPTAFRAIEQAAIENYLAQHGLSAQDRVTVRSNAIDWLKKHYPALCEKSGLCERVGGRLYTGVFIDAPTPPTPQDVQTREYAERYTWLRKALADRTKHGISHWICSIQEERPEELDAAIDAAIAAAKGKK